MAQRALSVRESELSRGDGASPEVFTRIAKVRSIDPPELSTDFEDATDFDSTDFIKEYVDTLSGIGTIGLEIHYLPDDPTHDATTGVIYDWKNRTERNYKIVFSNAAKTEWIFPCKVANFKPNIGEVGGKLTAAITLQVMGAGTIN